MVKIARLIGGAGCGKTTRLLDIMEKVIAQGQPPNKIGFVSFTRAARSEAATRAADLFGCRVFDLERTGWFRTLHSVCHRQLGISKELLTDCKADREWLEQALQEAVQAASGDQESGLGEAPITGDTPADAALALWGAARNRLEPLETIWAKAEAVDDRTPPLDECVRLIERYEQAKRLDGRVDFTDILAMYAGWKCRVTGAERCEPDGDVPELPVWFHDECQDVSRLSWSVFERLIEPSQWVYLCGDPFQNIYGWSGSDSRLFMQADAAKQDVLPKSYRCAAPILELGEAILRECSDYWDRGIAPADHAGEVDAAYLTGSVIDRISPLENWLLLARSNWHAKRLSDLLDERNIPWVSTRGRNRWDAPVRNTGLLALYAAEHGEPIDGEQWRHAVKLVPSNLDGTRLLSHGTKKKFSTAGYDVGAAHPWLMPANLEEVGATVALRERIASGAWRGFVEGAAKFADAIETWGAEAVTEPRVKVSTIHGSKGMEADNVLVLTTSSHQATNAMSEPDGFDAEQRVAYVAVTRARKRLIVARESTRHAMRIPA